MKFKSKADKKKFLRSIEDTEGVSLESVSSDDENVIEQSLMQLDNESDDEEVEAEEDLHLLMLAPDLLMDQDATMDSVLFFPTSHTVTDPLLASANPFVDSGAQRSPVGISPPDIVPENTSMNTPVVSIPPFKEEENPYSPDLDSIPLDEEMFPSLETPEVTMEPANPIPAPTHNYIILGGV